MTIHDDIFIYEMQEKSPTAFESMSEVMYSSSSKSTSSENSVSSVWH